MAAYEASIFQTVEKANQQMRDIFLKTVAQKIHEQQIAHNQEGIGATIFHPLHVVEGKTSFFAPLLEEDENVRFFGWLHCNVNDKYFNAALSLHRKLPQGTDESDFLDFLKLFNGPQIIRRIVNNPFYANIATFAVTENLLSTRDAKKVKATEYIASFCKKNGLDIETLRNYEKLLHLSAGKVEQDKIEDIGSVFTASDTTHSTFLFDDANEMVITSPVPKPLPSLTKEQSTNFNHCKQVIAPLSEKISEKSALDLRIRNFCTIHTIDVTALMEEAKTRRSRRSAASEHSELKEIPTDEVKEKPTEEIAMEPSGLEWILLAAERSLELDDPETEIIRAMKVLQSIEKYEAMVDSLQETTALDYTKIEKIIAICGCGLTEPYLLPMTLQSYETFVRKEENLFSQIKHEVYYSVAEKGMAALKDKPASTPLIRLNLRMEYIISVIELASYDAGFFSGEKITYTLKKGMRPQEKYIPPLFYRYREELKALIEKASSTKDLGSYLKEFNDVATHFQIELTDGSIYANTWHKQCLINLQSMANSLLDKGPEAESELSSRSSQSSQSVHSSSSSSFYSQSQSSSSSGSLTHSHSSFNHNSH